MQSFDKKNRTYFRARRKSVCARTGSRFTRRKFNYAQFGLIEELKAQFEYRSSFDEFFDIMRELSIFSTQFSRLPEVDLRTGNVLKRNFSPAL